MTENTDFSDFEPKFGPSGHRNAGDYSMSSRLSRFSIFLILLVSASSLGWAIFRDIRLERTYPGDLRNRVVGSRLQMDGRSPYFYHWTPEDGMRYYDWSNFQTQLKLSDITASPFLHQLMTPVANFSQRTISRIWVMLQYLGLLGMTLMAMGLAVDQRQRWFVLLTSCLFLQTYAWTNQIYAGQYYLFIGFFALGAWFFLMREKTMLNAAMAGLFAICLLLVRPNALLILLPLLAMMRPYSRRYIAVALGMMLLILGLEFGSSNYRRYWSDYSVAVAEHVKLHQGLSPTIQPHAIMPVFRYLEGFDSLRIEEAEKIANYNYIGEHGNLFILINSQLKTKLTLRAINGVYISIAVAICLFYFLFRRKKGLTDPWSLAILGACLYMACDLCSPVHRYNYNASQWAYPLLVTAAAYGPSYRRIFIIGILIALFLNSTPFSMFTLQHSMAEYLLLGCFLGLLYFPKSNQPA